MKIAIDISPLQNNHKVRGVGFYLQHLKDALIHYDTKNEYIFFTEYKSLKNDIDIVHFPYFDPFFITLPLINKYKTVVTVHDITPIVLSDNFPIGIRGKVKWEVQKRLLKHIDAIITDSISSKKGYL